MRKKSIDKKLWVGKQNDKQNKNRKNVTQNEA